MELTNDTVFRGYLAHIRSKAVEMAALHFEYMNHPDATEPVPLSDTGKQIRETWEILCRDVEKVLGVVLVPWNQLAKSSKLINYAKQPIGGRYGNDPLRIRMGVLKERTDKARLKDPEITLMKSWSK